MLSLITVLLFAIGIIQGDAIGSKTVKIYEWKSGQASCQTGTVMSISFANYGKVSRNCISTRSSDMIRKACNGRTTCSLSARNSVYGDPCWGTFKEIELTYTCVSSRDASGSNSIKIYEWKSGTVSCQTGTIISISFANYGKVSRNCISTRSSDMIRKACNGRISCSLSARNSVYGDPCRGTFKEIELKYTCVPSHALKIYEWKSGTVSCQTGTIISISFANYGKVSRNCISTRSSDMIRKACNGHTTCSLSARNSVYGDPCWGTFKEIELSYTCVPVPTTQAPTQAPTKAPTTLAGPTFTTGSICERKFKKIGCYDRDWSKVPHLLITDLDATHKKFSKDMNWEDYNKGLHSLACRCRKIAVENYYKYFAIGFNGECVAGSDHKGLEKMFEIKEEDKSGCINGNWESCDKNHHTECTGNADYDFFYQVL